MEQATKAQISEMNKQEISELIDDLKDELCG